MDLEQLSQTIIATLTKRIDLMSESLGAQLKAAEETLTADIAALTTAVDGLMTAFKGTAAGDPVTQSMIDAVNAADAEIKALAASATAAVTPAPAPAT